MGTSVPGAAQGAYGPQRPLQVRQVALLISGRFGDKALYDDKSAERVGFQFEGVHKGTDSKSKLETFLVSRCPMMIEIPGWAGQHSGARATSDNVKMVVQHLV